MPGTGIVYVRTRRRTKEIVRYLLKLNINADFYHGGLDPSTRDQKQQAWIDNNIRIMVCTNAFGMGIDKPNVRFVVHLDLPDSIEAYFQEAGRAGRDEKKAYALTVFKAADVKGLEERIEQNFPPKDEIRRVYQALANHYQLAIGAGNDVAYPFDLAAFCDKYEFNPIKTWSALSILKLDNYIHLSEVSDTVSKIQIEVTHDQLYTFQIANRNLDSIVKLLLRSYTGLYENLVSINEFELAKRANLPKDKIVKLLEQLAEHGIISYLEASHKPRLSFPHGRIDSKLVKISKMSYDDLKQTQEVRAAAVAEYVQSHHKCRSQQLLTYFGEENPPRCGVCDICLERNKLDLSNLEFEQVSEQIKQLLDTERRPLTQLVQAINGREDKSIKVIQWLSENGKIKIDIEGKYYWNHK